MTQITFSVTARGFPLAPRATSLTIQSLPFVLLTGLALWSSAAALLNPLLYAEIFSRF